MVDDLKEHSNVKWWRDILPSAREPYYADGSVALYCGDSLRVLRELRPYSIGALVTDPPYSSGGLFRGDRAGSTVAKYVQTDTVAPRAEFSGDTRDQRSFLAWASLWLADAYAAAAPGSPALVFSDWRQLPTMTDALQAGGWLWRNIATWWKPGVRMRRGRFSSSAEFIAYGTKGPATPGPCSPQNVFAHREHIAEKPLAVMAWALGVVPSAAIVLDPFAGAGTTLLAAREQGLRAIGIEADPMYCQFAARRLSFRVRGAAANQEALGL